MTLCLSLSLSLFIVYTFHIWLIHLFPHMFELFEPVRAGISLISWGGFFHSFTFSSACYSVLVSPLRSGHAWLQSRPSCATKKKRRTLLRGWWFSYTHIIFFGTNMCFLMRVLMVAPSPRNNPNPHQSPGLWSKLARRLWDPSHRSRMALVTTHSAHA